MKITHFITRFNRGGTARWLKTLLSCGDELMTQDLYAGFVEKNEIEDESFKELEGRHLKGLGRTPNLFQEVKSFFKIRNAIKNSNPDVINTHTSKAGLIGRLATLSLGAKRPALVHTFHGHLLYGYFSPMKIKVFTKLEIILAKYTDLLIAAGENVRDDLLQAGVGNTSKYVVINPGVRDLEFYSKKESRKILDIPESKIVVGWLGRLESVKAPERVLEIARKFPEAIFLVGGEGELRFFLEKKAPKNVIFLGWTEPESFWPGCDIALLTSLNEAQPISIIEAAKCSLPVIAEDVGSVSEVVKDSETGFLTHSFTERIIALGKLLESEKLRIDFGNSAKEYVNAKYSEDQFISSHLKAYKKAIDLHDHR